MNRMLRFSWVMILLVLSFSASVMEAQRPKRNYEGPGNWFMGVNVGTTLAMNENVHFADFFHSEIPGGFVQLGRTMSPYMSMRVVGSVSPQFGYPSKVAVEYKPEMFSPYRFFTAISTLDVMIDLSNCFRRYDTRNWFDGYFVIGGGGLFRFNVDEKVRYWYTDIYPVAANNYWFWAAKAGLEGAWHVARGWDLVAELDLYATDNAYNGVVGASRQWDIFLGMQIGMTYYFRNSQRRHRYANPPIVHKYWTELNEQ